MSGSVGSVGNPGAESIWDARFSGCNGFDIIRLVLATMVVFEHSYVLVDGSADREPLFLLSNGQAHFGALAVWMFFAISGALVTRSYLQVLSPTFYAIKRLARILPGFALATIVATFIISPLSANDPLVMIQMQDWKSWALSFLSLHQVEVSGAFPDNKITSVLSTLWTIKYEFDCYIIVGLLGVMGLLSGKKFWIFAVLIIFTSILYSCKILNFPNVTHGIFYYTTSNPVNWPVLFPMFFVGSAFWIYRKYIPHNVYIYLACIFLCVIAVFFTGMYWFCLICGPYVIFYSGTLFGAELRIFGRRVDLSYGVYLFGWPVAQLIVHLMGQRITPMGLFALSLPLTYLIALGSWFLVERPSLQLANAFIRSRREAI